MSTEYRTQTCSSHHPASGQYNFAVMAEQYITQVSEFAKKNPAVVGGGAAMAIIGSFMIFGRAKMNRDVHDYDSQLTGGLKILNNEDHTLSRNEFKESIDDYEGMFKGARASTGAITAQESVEERKARYAAMVDHFYNLVTDFYEWGWGQSFHFGPRYINETFMESIKRAEYHLCSRLGMKPGVRALDVGCGVGGPMRNMAMFSGATIGIFFVEFVIYMLVLRTS